MRGRRTNSFHSVACAAFGALLVAANDRLRLSLVMLPRMRKGRNGGGGAITGVVGGNGGGVMSGGGGVISGGVGGVGKRAGL
jgi:hypothetical protein